MLIDKFFLNLKKNFILKKMKYLGKNHDIHPTVRFKNPQYISIGNDCYIAANGVLEAWDEYNEKHFEPEIVIGNGVKINHFCHIGSINKIEIGNDCLLGSHVMIIDHSHGKNTYEELSIHPAKRDLFSKGGVKIGNRVWLCENSVILSGVTIGNNVIVAANAVVTTNVPENCVVAGVPARIVKTICK